MTYEIALIIGFVLVLVLIVMIMYIYEERNRCKHVWEETDRIRGETLGGFMSTQVHLKCKKCGDVKCRNLS